MIVDTQQIKLTTDCRDIIAQDLGKPQMHSAKYNAYKCPLHHERKGASLVVYADGWKCYGACQTNGDVIAWLVKYRGMTFHAAAEALMREFHISQSARPIQHRAAYRPEPSTEPPPAEWQACAQRIATKAREYLWSVEALSKLDYLRKRGLTDEMIEDASLGYVPPRSLDDLKYGRVLIQDWLKDNGKPVRIPCGIMIPHFADSHLWALRVRTDSGQPKYMGVAGGRNALYWADHVKPGQPMLIVEGEFDCLIVAQAIPDLVSPVAIIGASNARINQRWHRLLVTAPVILARMDNDDAGHRALAALQKLSPSVRAISVPRGKDVNEYFLGCGGSYRMRFTAWIENALDND